MDRVMNRQKNGLSRLFTGERLPLRIFQTTCADPRNGKMLPKLNSFRNAKKWVCTLTNKLWCANTYDSISLMGNLWKDLFKVRELLLKQLWTAQNRPIFRIWASNVYKLVSQGDRNMNVIGLSRIMSLWQMRSLGFWIARYISPVITLNYVARRFSRWFCIFSGKLNTPYPED